MNLSSRLPCFVSSTLLVVLSPACPVDQQENCTSRCNLTCSSKDCGETGECKPDCLKEPSGSDCENGKKGYNELPCVLSSISLHYKQKAVNEVLFY